MIYLTLVGWIMGPDAHRALRDSFRQNGVKFSPRRQLSDETRERLRTQAERARATARPRV
jgi:hypothetical protein